MLPTTLIPTSVLKFFILNLLTQFAYADSFGPLLYGGVFPQATTMISSAAFFAFAEYPAGLARHTVIVALCFIYID